MLIIATVVWFAVAAATPGYEADVSTFKAWAIYLSQNGIKNAYGMTIDYLPGNLYLMAGVGSLYRAIVDPWPTPDRVFHSQFLTLLIKTPPILFHLATATVVFFLVRRRRGDWWAWLAATALLFDPAALFDVGYWGAYDPVHALFILLAVAALAADRPFAAGVAIGLAALAKPQSWILMPLVASMAWRTGRHSALVRCAVGGTVVLIAELAPFIIGHRIQQLARLPDYMNNLGPDNSVVSANAHNLWWPSTLAAGGWIQDFEPIFGPLTYRWVGIALVAVVMTVCLARLWRSKVHPDPYLLTAALGAGWFLVTPRAHENHAFFVLPLLAVAWPGRPRLFVLYALASTALFANMSLQDPLVVGHLTGIEWHWLGSSVVESPLLYALVTAPEQSPLVLTLLGLTLVNVVLFVLLVGGLMRSVGLVSPLRLRRP